MIRDKKTTTLTAILFFLVGIILFSNPGGVVKFITYIFGGLFLLIGVIYFIQYHKAEEKNLLSSELYSGIISVIVGTIILFCAGAIELAIRLVTGTWILYRGFMNVRYAIYLKELKREAWIISAICSLLLFMVGLYIILRSNLILSSIGFILIIYGVIELIDILNDTFNKKEKTEIIKK